MKLKFYLLASLFFCVGLFSAQAQVTCEFTLEMYDSFGDGWNGSFLEVETGGETNTYTVLTSDNGGDFNIVTFTAVQNELITMTYSPGTFENEVTYFLYDADGNLIFSDGPNPTVGVVFNEAACPTCPAVDESTVTYTGTTDGAVVMWEASESALSYVVEYGPFGFEPGTGTTDVTATPSYTITGAEEGTIFDFYITSVCGGEDISVPTDAIFVQADFINPPLECTFVVELLAGNGFGWGGANIDIGVNGVFTNYTVAFNDNDGDFLLVELPIQSGTLITLDYNPDNFDDDNSYRLLSPEGQVLYDSGMNPEPGIGYQDVVFCPTCPAIDDESIEVTQFPGGFTIDFAEGQLPGDYIIEYGPLGFAQGTGTTEVVSTNSFTLEGQEEGGLFDVYIALDCGGGDVSFAVGPFFAQAGFTNPPTECTYTLEMFDSFGDGWNGSSVTVTINGMSTEYTINFDDNNGDFNIVEIAVQDGGLITLEYSPGSFENEVTYNLLDSDGIAVFSDGPFPEVGEVFTGVTSCPPCPLPLQSSFTADPVGSTTATVSWSEVTPAESYTFEYGANCFEPGTGTTIVTEDNSVELTDLEPETFYTYYLQGDCGAEGVSNTAGPFFFTTAPACYNPIFAEVQNITDTQAEIFYTPDPNATEYVVEYGPVGFVQGGGITTAPTGNNPIIINNLDPNTEYQFLIYGVCDGASSEVSQVYTFSTVLPCAAPSELGVASVTTTSAGLVWATVPDAVVYNIEYGPQGFESGTGVNVDAATSPFTLMNLNPGMTYDVYISSNCGAEDGSSVPFGPVTFTTESEPLGDGGTNGASCTYTLELYDSFGDGWNGSNLNVVNGDLDETYTINFDDNNGDFNIIEFEVVSGQPLVLTYFAGAFQNEVTYFLYDYAGNLVFQDGPNPATGEVYNEIAICPPCGGIQSGEVVSVRAEEATIAWEPTSNAESYIVEYGPVGFTIGTGTTAVTTDTEFTIGGLISRNYYNVFITPDCGADGLGVPFGPLSFQTYFFIDVGISGFNEPNNTDCLAGLENISVFIQNYGSNPQQLIPFFYSLDFMNAAINNPVDGLFTGVVAKDSSEVIDFDNQIDFSEPGYYYFEAWTELEGDENPANDTFSYEFITAYPLPLSENFNMLDNGTRLPDGWSSPNGVPILVPGENPHGLTNPVIGEEFSPFFGGVDTLEFTIAPYGPMEADSELTFDYRFVQADFAGTVTPYALDGDDYLRIDVSTDCGETYEELFVMTENDIVTTLFKEQSVSLADYAGEAITIRFQASNNLSSIFFVDIDNINIAGCPADLFIQIDQGDPVDFGTGNGTLFAQPTFGVAPFTFEWSNGQTTAVATGIGFADSYSVTVTDAQGCSSVRDFSPMLTDTEEFVTEFEKLTLAPNPTAGTAQLQVELPQAEDINVQIFDLAGREISRLYQENRASAVFALDLSDQPNGMYIVRLRAGQSSRVMKLAVAR